MARSITSASLSMILKPALVLSFYIAIATGSNSPAKQKGPLPAGYGSPPYYPTPLGGYVSEWTAAYQKAATVIRKMSLAEKVNITTGTGLQMV